MKNLNATVKLNLTEKETGIPMGSEKGKIGLKELMGKTIPVTKRTDSTFFGEGWAWERDWLVIKRG